MTLDLARELRDIAALVRIATNRINAAWQAADSATRHQIDTAADGLNFGMADAIEKITTDDTT